MKATATTVLTKNINNNNNTNNTNNNINDDDNYVPNVSVNSYFRIMLQGTRN